MPVHLLQPPQLVLPQLGGHAFFLRQLQDIFLQLALRLKPVHLVPGGQL